MIRDYQIVSPSLEGVLSESTLVYEGLRRPAEILRAFDGPASASRVRKPGQQAEERKVLEQYFQDLYGVFMKKFSFFIVGSDVREEDNVKLQAMLQEMIKVKGLITRV